MHEYRSYIAKKFIQYIHEASLTKNVVYNIPYACKEPSQVSCIRKTGKTLITRIKQHSEIYRMKTTANKLKAERKDNGLAYHHLKTGHVLTFFQNLMHEQFGIVGMTKTAHAILAPYNA